MKKFRVTVVTVFTIILVNAFTKAGAQSYYNYNNAESFTTASQSPSKTGVKTTKTKNKTTKAEPESYHTVSTNTLSVRSKPSANSSIVKKLRYKDKVIILESIDAKWVKIQAGAVTGYAYRKSLSLW